MWRKRSSNTSITSSGCMQSSGLRSTRLCDVLDDGLNARAARRTAVAPAAVMIARFVSVGAIL